MKVIILEDSGIEGQMTIAIVPRHKTSSKEVWRPIGAINNSIKSVTLPNSSFMRPNIEPNTGRLLESNKGKDTLPHYFIVSELQNKLRSMEGGCNSRQSFIESDSKSLNIKKSICISNHEMDQGVAKGYLVASNHPLTYDEGRS